MRYSSTLFALAAPLLALAAPARFYGKRAPADILVLKFADVLEQLESKFYEQALAKFQETDFQSAGFTSTQLVVEQLKIIGGDESTHSQALRSALKSFGETPLQCQYNFDSVLKDVTTMAAVARVVENVGVSAYLGGAILLTDPVLLASAGSILSVEARHSTVLNAMSGRGTSVPGAFDIPMNPSEILAIASPFISGCDLGIPSNTPLTITNTGPVGPGTRLTFQAASINGTVPEDKLFCQMLVGGSFASIPLPMKDCVVPNDINGPVAVFITSDGQPLLNNVKDRASSQLIAGPGLAFIDTQPQMLGQMLRTVQGSDGQNNAASTSTRTISPAEASSIIDNASSTSQGGASATPTASASASGASDVSASSSASAASASSPSSASSSSAASPSGGSVSNAASAPAGGSGPNLTTGKSSDGKITVNGWTGA